MPVRRSVVDTVVSPSYGVFCLHSRGEHQYRDLAQAGRRASRDGIGFAASAVGVATTEVGWPRVSVETWSRMPLILPDERPFDYAREGFVDFPDERWCISESCDPAVRLGLDLPSGPGEYGVRVVAYHHNTVRDRYEEASAGSAEEFAAVLTELRQPGSATREWYRIQLWPLGRGR